MRPLLFALLLLPLSASAASADSRGFAGPERPLDGGTFVPRGLGPVSRDARPGYLRGLAGGFWGVGAAPAAFALESAQALIFTPVRLVRAAISGDLFFLLEPLRTAKNLMWDSLWVGIGVLNCACAPVWNALRPDEATDFSYARNRLIFYGGPVAGLIKGTRFARAMAPSWHTVFVTREFGSPWLRHEFVHNKQIGRSLLAEHVGEDYEGFSGWIDEDAEAYLNW